MHVLRRRRRDTGQAGSGGEAEVGPSREAEVGPGQPVLTVKPGVWKVLFLAGGAGAGGKEAAKPGMLSPYSWGWSSVLRSCSV